MCVDVIDFGGIDPGILEGHFHGTIAAFGALCRGRNVIGVAGEAVAGHFSVDLCATRLGVLILFEHENCSAITHDKAVAILVVRA